MSVIATGMTGSGHNAMNDSPPDLPIEPRRRETPDEHRARMEAKRDRSRYFEGLSKAANAPSAKAGTQDTHARAVAAYKAGRGIKSVATEYGIGPTTLHRWLEEDGVPLRTPTEATTTARAATPAAQTAPVPAAKPTPRPGPPAPTATRAPTREEQDRIAAVNAYVQGDAVDEIAKRLGRGLSKIYAWLDDAAVPRRGRGVPTELDPAALATEYRAGLGVVALAGTYSTSPRRITAALREAGVDVTRSGVQRTATPDPALALPPADPSAPVPLSSPARAEPVDQPTRPAAGQPAARGRKVDAGERAAIVAAYAAGETAVAIASRHGRTPKTIRDTLRAAGVQMRDDRAMRSGGQRKEYDAAMVAEVRRLYLDEGLTQVEVAARIGSTAKVVQRLMDRHEIPARPDATGHTAEPRLLEPHPAGAVPPNVAPGPTDELALLREALRTRPPSTLPDRPEAIAVLAQAVEDVIAATRAVADRWTDLQVARDLEATAALARIRVSAEHVLALTTGQDTERTAS